MDLSCLTGDRDRDLGGKDGKKDLRESKSKRISKSNGTSKDVEAKVQSLGDFPYFVLKKTK